MYGDNVGSGTINPKTRMLTLNGVTIHLQDFGTILCIHLVGPSKEAIEEQFWSFYNHETTGGDLDWENDVCSPYHAFFWVYTSKKSTAQEKLLLGLTRKALAEMLPPNQETQVKGRSLWPDACAIGQQRYGQIDHVTWLDFRTEIEIYGFGDSVAAEKSTGNFDDDVLGLVVVQGARATLDALKDTDDETELEKDSEVVQVE